MESSDCVTRREFLRELERDLALPEGTLKEDQALATVKGWDSMAAVQFIALADEKTGVTLTGEKISSSNTIGDLLALLGDRLTA